MKYILIAMLLVLAACEPPIKREDIKTIDGHVYLWQSASAFIAPAYVHDPFCPKCGKEHE